MEEMQSGKLTSKGQLTVPSELRNHWGIDEGDRIKFILLDNGEVIARPIRKSGIRDIVGILKSSVPYDKEAINKSIEEHVKNEYEESLKRE